MKRLWLVVAAIGSVGAIAIIVMLVLPKSVIPGAIKKQVTSTLLLPTHEEVTAQRDTVKYDDSLKLLTLTLTAFGKPVVLSEQPTPETFTDIPQAYDKVVEHMGEYSHFDVDVGAVHLTRPPELKGKQAAVLNTKGTLMFAKPDRDLSNDEWKKFFNSLAVVK